MTGTERPSESVLNEAQHDLSPSVGSLGTKKLLEGLPKGPAPTSPSSEDHGREAAPDSSKAAMGRRTGRGREPGQPPAVRPSLASPAFLSPQAPLPRSLPSKFPFFIAHAHHCPRTPFLLSLAVFPASLPLCHPYSFFRSHLTCQFLQEVFPLPSLLQSR